MSSIFSRVYSYREREKKNNRENFLTEIFAFCLSNDDMFKDKFLKLIDHPIRQSLDVLTQNSYPKYGIPDLEIRDERNNSILIIESKVEHTERENQLEDYKNILKDFYPDSHKYLVYITKYYDQNHYADKNQDNISFTPLKWDQIYALITTDNSEITRQLKAYLKEEGMDDTKNFNFNDLASLTSISATISKMDEVLNKIRPVYAKSLGSFPATSKATKLVNSWYGVSDNRNIENFRCWINTGFSWDENNIVYVGIDFWLPAEASVLISQLKSTLNSDEDDSKTGVWIHYENGTGVTIQNCKYLSDFITNCDDQIPEIADYLNKIIEDISHLKLS